MKLCPTCQQCYEDVSTCCAYDQAPLISVRPGSRLIANKYSLDQRLGCDSLAATYVGTQLETDRPVAVKLLLPGSLADGETLKRFRHEAHAIAHLNTRVDHQHVAKTYDYGLLPDGTAYIVMELVAGQSLREYMDSVGQLPLATAVRIARQVADGLDAAHHCGVVHRGLEPSNIILARDYYGRVEAKVVDFGFAKLRKQIQADNGDGASGSEGAPSSSPRYASPEQSAGHNLDERSDIYSLGVILYEMLAGRLPFEAADVSVKNTEDQASPLKDLRADAPEPLAQLVMQSLNKRPSARPHSAAEIARQLRAIEGLPARAARVAPDLEAVAPARTTPRPTTTNKLTPSKTVSTHTSVPPITPHARESELKTNRASAAPMNGSEALPEGRKDAAREVAVKTSVASQKVSARPAVVPPAPTPKTPPPAAAESGVLAPAQAAPNVTHAASTHQQPLAVYASLATIAIVLGIVATFWYALWPTTLDGSSASLAASPSAASAERRAPENSAASEAPAVESLPPSETEESAAESLVAPLTTAGSVKSEKERDEKEASSGAGDEAADPKIIDAQESSPSATKPLRGSATPPDSEANSAPGRKPDGRGDCALTVSEGSLTLRNDGGSEVVTVNLDGPSEPAPITATTPNWENIVVFSEPRTFEGNTVRYSITSVSKRAGTYSVSFRSRCGSKTIPVTVR